LNRLETKAVDPEPNPAGTQGFLTTDYADYADIFIRAHPRHPWFTGIDVDRAFSALASPVRIPSPLGWAGMMGAFGAPRFAAAVAMPQDYD